jgi:hypothetical protein
MYIFRWLHISYRQYNNPTEDDFLHHVLPSPQCLFLTRTEDAYRNPGTGRCTNMKCGEDLRQNFSKAECDTVYESFVHDLDWVGTTNRMSTDTMQLLQAVSGHQLVRSTF